VEGRSSVSGWYALLGAVTLLGSFLLFLVQPIEGRLILPWFGGGAEVWTTTLLFFQAALLLGYGYSHLLSRLPSRRTQAIVHATFVLAAALALPIVPDEAFRPDGPDAPLTSIIILLTVTAGPPYLLLATTAPLLQRWAADLWPGRSPYRLYAVSNVAAIVALAAYPVVIEPVFGLQLQTRIWSAGYLMFAAGVVALGWRLARSSSEAHLQVSGSASGRGGPGSPDGRVTTARFLLWVGAAAAGTTMLTATTNALADGIVTFPFLWVWPLALYLLTFVVAFSSDRAFHPTVFLVLFVASCWYAVYAVGWTSMALAYSLPVHLGVLFVTCMALHGEIARSRPAPERLTSFYVAIAAGGALGGAFVAVAAPLLFVYRWEYPIGVVAAAVLLTTFRTREWHLTDAAPRWVTQRPRILGASAILALAVLLGWQGQTDRDGLVAAYRNFYGTVEVRAGVTADGSEVLRIVHAGTNHGAQFLDPARREEPTSYYTASSGLGLAMAHHPARDTEGVRVGIMGLGAGSIAAYANPGDHWTFYEINPLMVEIADEHFTFLADARARGVTLDTVLGDGRLMLADALEDGAAGFDLLVLDAFTGGAIPTHLLTREAFEVYREHMAPAGVIAVQTSNRYLRLDPVMRALADEFDMQVLTRSDDSTAFGSISSQWAILGDDLAAIESGAGGMLEQVPDSEAVLWTDDRQDLWRVLDLRP